MRGPLRREVRRVWPRLKIKDVESLATNVLYARHHVILSSRTVDWVSDRIEKAYSRRFCEAPYVTWDTRVWSVAARALLEQHQKTPWLPVDPELFVASQCRAGTTADPWSDLAPPQAIRRYQSRILQIIRKLRAELKHEVRRAERAIARGDTVERLIARSDKRFSPIGKLILAHRAGRADLVETLRIRARHQHDACPLYRSACQSLLPLDCYPVSELVKGLPLTLRPLPQPKAFCLN